MQKADFVIIGSGGGGGTIAWVLARAGFDVVLLEQGADWAEPLVNQNQQYVPLSHDEYRFRIERPEFKRRLRGDYNTFRETDLYEAVPFGGGWTGSQFGGGSVLWGGWGFRALPIDFVLGTHFKSTGQDKRLREWGYAVDDWPISYSEIEPYFNVAETLFAVGGDRQATNEAIKESGWFKRFSNKPHFAEAGNWLSQFPFPEPPYPQTPSGDAVRQGMESCGMHPVPAPSAMVSPGSNGFSTRDALASTLSSWSGDKPSFWSTQPDNLWSDRIRDACNLCGFCGEYLCWGRNGPKSSTRSTTLRELADLKNANVVLDAKVYEIIYDQRLRRASGVRYLDLSDSENPISRKIAAKHVVVSCGAIQSARLLLMSSTPGGLGNRFDQVGRNVMFHLFGLGATCVFPLAFQGTLRGELGHTGNTASFEHYFIEDSKGEWWKGGIVVSTSKKNPLEGAYQAFKSNVQATLLEKMEDYSRTVEVRITGDDFPMPSNRVDLDPRYVDEHGLPVARITRTFGPNERILFNLARPKLREIFLPYEKFPSGVESKIATGDGRVDLFGDHQMGTCRMGDDPRTSVLDRYCRIHDVPNIFVVDSACMTTGLGVNPMMTVVANALRVGTWIVEQSKRGSELDS